MTKILGSLFISAENGIVDDSPNNHTIDSSVCTLDTTNKVYGSSSVRFDGGPLVLPNSDLFNLPEDFTIDFWMRNTGPNQYTMALCNGIDGNGAYGWWIQLGDNSFSLLHNSSGAGYVYVINQNLFGTVVGAGWFHVALTRSSGVIYVFKNGVLLTSVSNSLNFTSTNPLYICGLYNNAGCGLYGNMDNIRIVKDQALWTSNFELTEEALFYKDAVIPSSYVRPDNIKGLYDISLKSGIRNAAKNGFIRPTLSEMFMTHKDFVEVPSLIIPTYNWDTSINSSYTYDTVNIKSTKSVSNWTSARLNAPLPNSGKYYWEIDSFGAIQVGLATEDFPYDSWDIWYSPLKGTKSFSYYYNVNESGRVAMVAVDVDAKKVWFGANGSFGGNPANGTSPDFTMEPDTLYPTVSIYHAAASSQATWGTAHFTKFLLKSSNQLYTPPVGFIPLN